MLKLLENYGSHSYFQFEVALSIDKISYKFLQPSFDSGYFAWVQRQPIHEQPICEGNPILGGALYIIFENHVRS